MFERNAETMSALGDISVLYQYLFMDEEHSITFNNGLADLTVKMTEGLGFVCKNGNFPEFGWRPYTDEMTPYNVVGIIDILKTQKPQRKKVILKNRWDEIKTEVSLYRCLQISKNQRAREVSDYNAGGQNFDANS